MGRLYQRRAKILIGSVEIETDGGRGLRLEIDVKKSPSLKTPNTAEIKIANLAGRTRRELDALTSRKERSARTLYLEAGYKGQLTQIYAGELTLLQSFKEATGWTTHILAATGLSASQAIANKVIAKGKSNGEMFEELLLSVQSYDPGVQLGEAMKRAKAKDFVGALTLLVKSFVASGSSADLLDALAKNNGMEIFNDDDELILVEENKALKHVAVVLGPSTGLIGSPQRIQDDKHPDALVFKAQALMDGRISIGRLVRFETTTLSGDCIVRSLQHRGDTHGSDWVTEFEAVSR